MQENRRGGGNTMQLKYGFFKLAAVLLTFVVPFAMLTDSLSADDLPKEQKIDMVRRLLKSEPYASEMGGFSDPCQYINLSDGQVAQELRKIDQDIGMAQKEHYLSQQRLATYEGELVRSGKTTTEKLHDYIDPSGKLGLLRQQVNRKYQVLQRDLCKKVDLQVENLIRTNPDQFFDAEADLQKLARHSRERAELIKARMASDPGAGKRVSQPGKRASIQRAHQTKSKPLLKVGKTGGQAGDEKTFQVGAALRPQLSSLPQGGETLEVNYGDLYGVTGASVTDIEAFEARELQTLPSELRRCSPEVQRLFFYGGYENLPREIKRIVRHACRQSPQKVEEIYRWIERQAPPPEITSPNRQQGVNAGFHVVSWALYAVAQHYTDDYYDNLRKEKFEAAVQQVAADIPKGEKEKVVLIEEVKKRQLDLHTWFETVSVKGLRGEIDVDQQGEYLKDLRNASNNSVWHFYRIFTPTVVGTGKAEITREMVKQAYEDGAAMGRLARSAKGSKDLFRKTYAKYNKHQETREAFKRGYRLAADGKIH